MQSYIRLCILGRKPFPVFLPKMLVGDMFFINLLLFFNKAQSSIFKVLRYTLDFSPSMSFAMEHILL